ncbi:polysaccharide deacetylase family protein [Kroppenstedtia pulmonis]|uniref:Polysaccharide deacetylase family protein n=1 Tax=Kroppenstedtia pulmonis TaxID=1380685 RepID=A0A7D3XMM4_9BACL|nr:polysaccharide deacetylase family protein [Kroppenstedtia pulmonis]QKG84429.1 polysaccharide deacetylase family protein [Kroppenstedtia pulmonis]
MRYRIRTGLIVTLAVLLSVGCTTEGQEVKPDAEPALKKAETKSPEEKKTNDQDPASNSLKQSDVDNNDSKKNKSEAEEKPSEEQQSNQSDDKKKEQELEELKEQTVVYRGPRHTKQVALTFDDGPDQEYTKKILNILREEKVPATFFVVGNMARNNPEMLKRIDEEGHVLANHSWNHPYLPRLSDKKLDQELMKTNRMVKKVTGKEMQLVRPPYGAAEGIEKKIRDKGFTIVNWDVDTKDWTSSRTSSQIQQVIKSQAVPGSIILMHSAGGNREQTVQALPHIISHFRNQGYDLVTVDQLLAIPAYQKVDP